jgi:hypothetical protein
VYHEKNIILVTIRLGRWDGTTPEYKLWVQTKFVRKLNDVVAKGIVVEWKQLKRKYLVKK